MIYEEFEKIFLKSGRYETPEAQRLGYVNRFLGWSDTLYYWRNALIVRLGAQMVRRNKWNQQSWARLSFRIWQAVEGAGGRIIVEGGENLAALEFPAVIIGNHMSMLETFLLPAAILPYQLVTLVVKESLVKLPVFGIMMRGGVRPVVVTRNNPREDLKTVMRCGQRVLKEGRSIIVFPQSTRSTEFCPDNFNSLGVKLASRAGVPVVPLALKTDFQRLGKIFKDMGKLDRSKPVHVKFGKPMMVKDKGREEHNAVLDFIADNLRAWGGSVKRKAVVPQADPPRRKIHDVRRDEDGGERGAGSIERGAGD